MRRIKFKKLQLVASQCRSFSNSSSLILTRTTKKLTLTDVLDFSRVNFKFEWKLFKRYKKPSRLSSPSVQIKRCTLYIYIYIYIYINHTFGFISFFFSGNSFSTSFKKYMHREEWLLDFRIKFKVIIFQFNFSRVN